MTDKLDTTAVAESAVGTQDRNAGRSETQNNPHPGRGEGDHYGGVTDMIDEAARAPTTYGKGEREELRLALLGMRSWALEMIRKHADPNGSDYEQGQQDMGHRWVASIDDRLRALQLGRE